MSRRLQVAIAALAALVVGGGIYLVMTQRSASLTTQPGSTAATPVAPPNLCGGGFPPAPPPQISPIISTGLTGGQSNNAADCFMWQSFIYLNWPAQPGAPGQPDKSASFGGSAPVVWETFKSYDQVFLPDGTMPPPWNQAPVANALPQALQAQRRSGALRLLSQTSKLSPDLPASITSSLPFSLTQQVGGGELVDQAGNIVYYEEMLNEDEFNYIVDNQLYNADQQYITATTSFINLPLGPTQYGPIGAIELKAAWKVLTQAELNARPLRFHTAQALLPGSTTPVTVGLVGLHIIQRPTGFAQGFWATFAQMDNVPLQASPGAGPYSFYNPQCSGCKPNTITTPPTPTQAEQVFAVANEAMPINAYLQAQIAALDPNSPWQFYQLLDVQWPTSPVPTQQPGQKVMCAGNPQICEGPLGTPNTTTLMNPVLETFLQAPNVSCLGCHGGATVAPVASNPNPQYLASYSFLFAHAKSSP